MNGPFFPPQALLAQLFEGQPTFLQGEPNAESEILRNLDPQIIHTREQLKTLQALINNVESLTKFADRPDDEEGGPTVLVGDENTQAAASAIVMHASNRIIDILQDNSRWKANPGGKTKEDQDLAKFEAQTAAIAQRQEINERIDNHNLRKKIEGAKVKAICKKIGDGSLPVVPQQPQEQTQVSKGQPE